jgi:hypothetical protein
MPLSPASATRAAIRSDLCSHADIRPVQGATVNLLGHPVTTNRRGVAEFKLPGAGWQRAAKVTASAGNKF